MSVVLVAIDDRPHRLLAERPPAGEHAEAHHRRERLPLAAYQKRRQRAFQHRHAAGRFGIARRDAVPDSPDVFPTLKADAVEERVLQVGGVIAIPAIGDVYHVTRLQPFVVINARRERRNSVLSPRHQVVGERFVGRAAFGLEDERMSNFVGGFRERQRNAVLRVAVDSVGADISHDFRDRVGPRLAGIARALVPHHHREKHAHSALVKVGDHLPHAGDATRHRANHVVLIAIVDAHIRICGPDQYRVDAAVAFLEIVEIAIDRIFARDRIVEIAILDHHLRLDEARLRPRQRRDFVARAVVADSNETFHAPVPDVGEPRIVLGDRARRYGALRAVARVHTRWAGNLFRDGVESVVVDSDECRILRGRNWRRDAESDIRCEQNCRTEGGLRRTLRVGNLKGHMRSV